MTILFDSNFSPLSLPNLSLWLDADNASSIVRGSDKHVAEWIDYSNSGTILNSPTSSAQPQTELITINNRNALNFDNNDYLEGAPIDTSLGLTVFCVLRRAITDSSFRIGVGRWNSSTNDRSFVIGKDNANRYYAQWSIDGFGGASTRIINTFNTSTDPVLLRLSHDGSSGYFHLDGASYGSASGVLYNPLSTNLIVGAAAVGSPGWIDAICEVIVCTNYLDNTDCVSCENYLYNKWQLT